MKKIIFSSSVGVYGAAVDDPTDEETPLRWQQIPSASVLYGASKVVGEGLARCYHERYGLDFVALRYSGVYGERQHGRAVVGGHIAETCARVIRGEPPIINGDGLHVHDYIYAGDVARANLMAMESAVTSEGMNICSGVDTPQLRVAEIVMQACGSTLKPEHRSLVVTRLPPTTKQAYSREKAKRLLDWELVVSIEEGIGKVLKWFRESRSTDSSAQSRDRSMDRLVVTYPDFL